MEQNIYAGEFAETETIVLGLSRYGRCEVALHMDDYRVYQALASFEDNMFAAVGIFFA